MILRRLSLCLLVLSSVLVAPIVLSSPSQASSNGPWVDTEIDLSVSPDPFEGAGGLAAVDCATGTTCDAAGSDFNPNPLAVTGDATTWGYGNASNVDLVDAPSTLLAGSIFGISCWAYGECVAVGNDGNGQPLVLEGNPATWTLSEATELSLAGTPSDGGGGGELNSVSCVSSSWCVAVGSDDNGQPIVLTGNPTSWNSIYEISLMDPSFNGTPTTGTLQSVSCVSETFCVAVGDDQNYEPDVVWGDPTSWVPADVYESPDIAVYEGVSCTSETFCVAVGYDDSDFPVLETGDPSTWSTITPAQLVDVVTGSGGLDAVTCTSETNCVAVGGIGGYPGEPLIYSGDPSTWTSSSGLEITLSSPDWSGGGLNAVSCTGPSTCVAVGYADNNGGYPGPLSVVEVPSVTTSFLQYPVTYLAGGGTGTLPATNYEPPYGTFSVASGSSLTRAGYTFSGWSDGTSVYQPGATYTMGFGPVTFTALWTPVATPVNTPTTTTTTTPSTHLRASVYFPFNKYYLISSAQRSLKSFAVLIARSGVRSFTVVGSTDLFGSEAYNYPLSDHRAHVVSAFLLQQLALLGVTDVVFHDLGVGISRSGPTYTSNRRTVVSD